MHERIFDLPSVPQEADADATLEAYFNELYSTYHQSKAMAELSRRYPVFVLLLERHRNAGKFPPSYARAIAFGYSLVANTTKLEGLKLTNDVLDEYKEDRRLTFAEPFPDPDQWDTLTGSDEVTSPSVPFLTKIKNSSEPVYNFVRNKAQKFDLPIERTAFVTGIYDSIMPFYIMLTKRDDFNSNNFESFHLHRDFPSHDTNKTTSIDKLEVIDTATTQAKFNKVHRN